MIKNDPNSTLGYLTNNYYSSGETQPYSTQNANQFRKYDELNFITMYKKQLLYFDIRKHSLTHEKHIKDKLW